MRRFFLPAILIGLLFSSVTALATDVLPLTIINGFSRQLQSADDLLIHDRLTSTAVLILEPGGTGALQGDSAGNARGADATDWQRSRAANTEVASGVNSVLSGGGSNTASGSHSVIAGGLSNEAGALYSSVGGGFTNTVDSDSSSANIAGGNTNTIGLDSPASFIGGGFTNAISATTTNAAQYTLIAGGRSGVVTDSQYAAIGGGQANEITGTSTWGTISGGNDSTIDASLAAGIGGGRFNDIADSSLYATVAGGINNNITSSARGAILGGENHDIITATHATICGGSNNNLTSADYAFMAGGLNNTTSSGADYSFCTGRSNEVTAIYSEAHGLESRVVLRGEMAQASGHFAVAGDAQTAVMTVRNQTTDATVTSLFLNGSSNAMDLPANSLWTFHATVSGLQDTGANGAGYLVFGVLRRDASGGATLVGTVTTTVIGEDVAAWTATAIASGNAVVIRVTGAAATNINWVARVEVTQTIVAN